MIDNQVVDLVRRLNPLGQGRIIHHLRTGRYHRAREVCSQALGHAFRVWRTSRAPNAFETYYETLGLWRMIWQLESEQIASA